MYHGDIKSENVLVTSWSWVLLADIASFKPVCLPVDNPADFNYFFDTSRRRTCYIAPERFVGTGQKYTEPLSGSQSDTESKLSTSPSTPLLDVPITEQSEMTFAMDIFSAGYKACNYLLVLRPDFEWKCYQREVAMRKLLWYAAICRTPRHVSHPTLSACLCVKT